MDENSEGRSPSFSSKTAKKGLRGIDALDGNNSKALVFWCPSV